MTKEQIELLQAAGEALLNAGAALKAMGRFAEEQISFTTAQPAVEEVPASEPAPAPAAPAPAPAAPAPTPAPAAPVVQAPPPAAAAPAQPQVTVAQVREALTALHNRLPAETREQQLQSILQPHGADRISALAEEHYAAVHAAAQTMLTGLAH